MDRESRCAVGASEGSGRAGLTQLSQEELETRISAAWRAAFRVERIGREENFFELGGNSLLGMDLTEMLADCLGIEVPVTLLFQYPSIREMTEILIASEEKSGNAPGLLDR